LNKYTIKLLSAVYRDLDQIYEYIIDEFQDRNAAEIVVSDLENAIISLEMMPYRGSLRQVGAFKNKEYRQLFVKRFTIIYRINEINKQVIIVTVKYSRSEF